MLLHITYILINPQLISLARRVLNVHLTSQSGTIGHSSASPINNFFGFVLVWGHTNECSRITPVSGQETR